MKIVCPSCSADYRMSEDKIPDYGACDSLPVMSSQLHSLSRWKDGVSRDAFTDTGAPPSPPPPPIDLGGDDFDFAQGGGLIAPPSASDTNVEIEPPSYSVGLDSLDPAAAPSTSSPHQNRSNSARRLEVQIRRKSMISTSVSELLTLVLYHPQHRVLWRVYSMISMIFRQQKFRRYPIRLQTCPSLGLRSPTTHSMLLIIYRA